MDCQDSSTSTTVRVLTFASGKRMKITFHHDEDMIGGSGGGKGSARGRLRDIDWTRENLKPINEDLCEENTAVTARPQDEINDVKPVISSISRSATPRLARFSPYESDKPKRGRPKKIRANVSLNYRRKAMNRDAALRYRERKKFELDQLKVEADDLVVANQILNEQASQLEQEIKIMKMKLNHQFDLKFDFLTAPSFHTISLFSSFLVRQ